MTWRPAPQRVRVCAFAHTTHKCRHTKKCARVVCKSRASVDRHAHKLSLLRWCTSGSRVQARLTLRRASSSSDRSVTASCSRVCTLSRHTEHKGRKKREQKRASGGYDTNRNTNRKRAVERVSTVNVCSCSRMTLVQAGTGQGQGASQLLLWRSLTSRESTPVTPGPSAAHCQARRRICFTHSASTSRGGGGGVAPLARNTIAARSNDSPRVFRLLCARVRSSMEPRAQSKIKKGSQQQGIGLQGPVSLSQWRADRGAAVVLAPASSAFGRLLF